MNWIKLRDEFGDTLVDAIQNRLRSGSSPQVDKAPFLASGHTIETIDAIFDCLVELGALEAEVVRRCPDCRLPIPDAVPDDGVCPHCEFDLGMNGLKPVREVLFLVKGKPSREIPWLVAIHGFNTHGEWQENFSWLMATQFRHRAPAMIYKFPFLFFGILLRSRHASLADDLDRKLRTAIERARASGIDDPPDIIAHSFGALLLTKLLDRPGSRDLKFGRIIVAGSIVRPDYAWSRHLSSGRIEAVMNHCSKGDYAVVFSEWGVPDAGPSGKLGFDDRAVVNYLEQDFGHGTHFDPETMIESLQHDGTWDTFLRLPLASMGETIRRHRPETPWRPTPAFITGLTRGLVILFSVLIAAPAMFIVAGGKFIWRGTV